MAYGWHDSLGPGGPSFDSSKFEEAQRRRRPPRSRWLAASAACFMAAVGATVLVAQSIADAHWILLIGGGLWWLAGGLIFVWRAVRRVRHADSADAPTRPSAPAAKPSWWLQPMSRRQATVLGLPLIAATVVGIAMDSDNVALAWTMLAGGTFDVAFLVLAYLRSERSVRVRRFRVEEDDSGKKWRPYRWPRGARTLR